MNVETLNLVRNGRPNYCLCLLGLIRSARSVVLIHELVGHQRSHSRPCGTLCGGSYLCVAPDLFRGQVAADAQEASA